MRQLLIGNRTRRRNAEETGNEVWRRGDQCRLFGVGLLIARALVSSSPVIDEKPVDDSQVDEEGVLVDVQYI